MKRILLRMLIPVVLGFLYSTVGFGQTLIDRMDQHADRVYYDEVFPLGEDAWLFSGRGNPEGGQPSDLYFVAKRTEDGTQLWRFGHYLMSASLWGSTSSVRAKRISVLQDDGVVIAGVVDGCDVVTGQCAVIRLDNDGEPVWQLEFTFSDFNHIPGSHAGIFDRLADGFSAYHAIASQDSIISLNDDGEILHRWLSPTSPVHCMRWENDTMLLVGAGNGVFRTRIDGTVLSSFSLEGAEYILDIRKEGERVLALTSDQIAVFSDDLQFSHWIPTPAETYGFVDADDEVWLSAGGTLQRIDENGLTQLLETGMDAMAYRDGLVMTASWAGHHGRSGGRMKSYLMDGTTVSHQDDVEIIGSLDSTTIRGINYITDIGPVYQYIAHATAHVVNRSDATVSKVLLSHYPIISIGMCVGPGRTMVVENLNLAPGDTAKIPFPDLYLQSTPLFTGGSEVSMQVCVVAISPNDHLDIFPDDNRWCEEVTFNVPVGMEEAAAPQEMKVFPNPTAGVFDVQGTLGMPANVTLIDMTGRLLHSQQTTDGRLRMDISALPSGLYLVRYETAGGIAVRRVSLIR